VSICQRWNGPYSTRAHTVRLIAALSVVHKSSHVEKLVCISVHILWYELTALARYFRLLITLRLRTVLLSASTVHVLLLPVNISDSKPRSSLLSPCSKYFLVTLFNRFCLGLNFHWFDLLLPADLLCNKIRKKIRPPQHIEPIKCSGVYQWGETDLPWFQKW